MRIDKYLSFCIVCLSGLIFFSCQQTLDTFPRTNEKDPLSENFTPTKSSGISYEIQDNRLILSWDDDNELWDGYIIEKAVSGNSYKEIKTLSSDSRKFEDQDIDHFTLSYKVSPFIRRDGEIHKADYKELFLNRYQPGYLTFNINSESNTQINFEHNPPDNLLIEGYELERWEATSFIPHDERDYQLVSKITDSLNFRNISFTEKSTLRNGYSYDYRIRAYNRDGKSHYTRSHCCYSFGFHVLPPTILSAVQESESSITLNWKYNDNKADSVIIERSIDDRQNFREFTRLDVSQTSVQDYELDKEKEYFYRIKTLGSDYSDDARIVFQKGIKLLNQVSTPGPLQNINTRPNFDEFVTVHPRVTTSSSWSIVKLWKSHEGYPYEEVSFSNYITDIDFHNSGEYLVMSFRNGYVRTFRPGDISNYAESSAKQERALKVSLQNDNDIAAIGYIDGVILIMEFTSFNGDPATIKKSLKDFTVTISDLQYTSDGERLIAAGEDGTLIVYDATNNYSILEQINGHNDEINQISISNDDSMLASAGSDNFINIWDLNDLTIHTSFTYSGFGRYHKPLSVKFSKDENFLFVGTSNNLVLVWDIEEDKLHQILSIRDDGISDWVNDMAITQSGAHLLSSSYSSFHVWELYKQWIKVE